MMTTDINTRQTDEEARHWWTKHCETQLRDHKRYYERTKNPLWLYEAIEFCDPNKPYPDWIDKYFRESARDLRMLTFNLRRKSTDPKVELSAADATASIPDALGFRRAPNWNAIEHRRLDNERMGTLIDYAATPEPKRRALAGQLARIRTRTGRKSSKATIRRLLKEAINLEKP